MNRRNKTTQKMQRVVKTETRTPPQVKNNPMLVRVLRFVVSDGADISDLAITRACLLKLAYATVNPAANGITLWSGVLLKKVKVWSTTNDAKFVSNSIEWQSRYGPTALKTSSGTFSSPAYVNSSPPADSLSSFWSNSRDNSTYNEVLFYLTCPAGSIVDIHLMYTQCNGKSSDSECMTVTAVGAPTTNTVYYNDLDNTTVFGAAGGGRIRPVDVISNLAT